MYGETRDSCKVLVWKPDGKRPLGRPSRTIRMYLEKIIVGTWNGFIWLMAG
jgi:hypothetical protein